MDVRCERCRAEYVFDDAQVTEAGVTVRCSGCGHVFKVKKKALVVTVPVKPDEIAGAEPIQTAAAVKSGSGPPSASPSRPREWRLRQANGNAFTFKELTTLQKWIVERKVSRDDELSLSGEHHWKRLGNIAELASFFEVVEAANRVQAPASGPPVAPISMPPVQRPSSLPSGYALSFPPAISPSSGPPSVAARPGVPPATGTVAHVPVGTGGPGGSAAWEIQPPAPPQAPIREPAWTARPRAPAVAEVEILSRRGGGGRMLVLLLALAVVVGGAAVYFLRPEWIRVPKLLKPDAPLTAEAKPDASASQPSPAPAATTTPPPLKPVPGPNPEAKVTVPEPKPQVNGEPRPEPKPPEVKAELRPAPKAPEVPREPRPEPKPTPKPPAAVGAAADLAHAKPQAPSIRERHAAANAQPVGVRALLAQAKRLRDQGKAERALDLYGQVAEQAPDHAEALAGRGWCYLDLSEYSRAEASFEAALQREPDSAEALMGLAETYRYEGREAEAVKFYEKYLAAHPDGDDAVAARNAITQLKE